MRGYYRAVKRGIPWAVKIANLEKKSIFSFYFALSYRNVNWKEVFFRPSFFDSISISSDGQWGICIPIPLKSEDK